MVRQAKIDPPTAAKKSSPDDRRKISAECDGGGDTATAAAGAGDTGAAAAVTIGAGAAGGVAGVGAGVPATIGIGAGEPPGVAGVIAADATVGPTGAVFPADGSTGAAELPDEIALAVGVLPGIVLEHDTPSHDSPRASAAA